MDSFSRIRKTGSKRYDIRRKQFNQLTTNHVPSRRLLKIKTRTALTVSYNQLTSITIVHSNQNTINQVKEASTHLATAGYITKTIWAANQAANRHPHRTVCSTKFLVNSAFQSMMILSLQTLLIKHLAKSHTPITCAVSPMKSARMKLTQATTSMKSDTMP